MSDAKKHALGELLFSRIREAFEHRELGEAVAYEVASDAQRFAEHFLPGEVRVRVSNPDGAREGRTVLEVLTTDAPFLVDTIRLKLSRTGLRELVFAHPLLPIEREEDGSIAAIGNGVSARESYIYAELPIVEDPGWRDTLRDEIESVLCEVQRVVAHHGAMLERLRDVTTRIDRQDASFLEWLADDCFVFLGYRAYTVDRTSGEWSLTVEADSGLGVLRDLATSRFSATVAGRSIPETIRTRLHSQRRVFLDKSRTESTIHRRGRLDSVSVKLCDADGEATGYVRFVGLLTFKGIHARPTSIAMLKERCARVVERIGAEPGSHTYKACKEAFDSLPIEFLIPYAIGDVTEAVKRIIDAAERNQVEVCVVRDPLNRSFFVSVILPRPLYDEALRHDIDQLLVRDYEASYIDHRSSFLDEDVALIHFFCSSSDDVDATMLERLESDIHSRVARWEDRFESVLCARFTDEVAYRLEADYGPALPDSYRVTTPADEAVEDVIRLEKLRLGESEIEIRVAPEEADPEAQRLKIFQHERPYLTDLLPVLDQFGIRVIDATLTRVGAPEATPRWIAGFRIEAIEDGAAAERLIAGLECALSQVTESDALNRLVGSVGLTWRQVDVLRAYLAFGYQLGIAPARLFVANVLERYPDATRALVRYFEARFDPAAPGDRASHQAEALGDLREARGPIATAGEDSVFAMFANFIESTLRTNAYRRSPTYDVHLLAFKIFSSKVRAMPSPSPYREIFVHSAEVTAVHLRGGPVARGGLRWSDRLQDVRTEILGLVKTQMVKNGLIVPVGSKGGFALKRHFDDPAEARAEAERQYERFVTALLSITDNKVDGQIEPPPDVVRHDGDDPYLVVAADKGTAHLSDTANAVAEGMAFWLGDAFASGGSRGYDHKAEGITARGAWVCVEHHFREMGVDTGSETYTVAGIGDMGGDVFGNGLLCARRGKLLAAFDHVHVFCDPDPDPDISWRERKRLFELPRSAWSDYDVDKISRGGGVFDRNAKSIPLSPEIRQMLDVEAESMSGEALVHTILKMRVDLLWNGGIGTYVKASSESHADVGDRANEAVRIDARELRAKVVGEGGNLGFTQLARVEYALRGGRINTDATDNSGGVDLSDHEVNYKILLAPRCAGGTLSHDERDRVLRQCVDDANAAVLDHNVRQARSLSMDRMRGAEDPERMIGATNDLAERIGLDRAIEFLPDGESLRARSAPSEAPSGYCRPELSILLGYTKMLVKRELTRSEVPDHATVRSVYEHYFPPLMRERFVSEIANHALRREITATELTNAVIDCSGVTLVPELSRALGASVADIVAAYFTAGEVLGATRLREMLDAAPIAEPLRLHAQLRIEDNVRLAAAVLLELERKPLLAPDEIEAWRDHTAAMSSAGMADPAVRERTRALVERGLDEKLAGEIEVLPVISRSLGAVSLARSAAHGSGADDVLAVYREVGERTRIDWLCSRLRDTGASDSWSRVAGQALFLEMLQAQRSLAAKLIATGGREPVRAWVQFAEGALAGIERTAQQIESESGRADLAAMVVLSQQIRRLC